jgi:hypothetical protein
MIEEEIPESAGSVYGHNSGDMLAIAKADLVSALYDDDSAGKTFAQRKSEFLTSASRQSVTSRSTAAAAADTIKLAGEVKALIEAARKQRSDPFREVHLALAREAAAFWEPVDEAMAGLRRAIDVWAAAEDDRIAQQQREQEEELARMRAGSAPPPAPPPPPAAGRAHIDYAAPAPAPARSTAPQMRQPRRSRIRGDLGATISATQVSTYEIEDWALLPDHILKSPTVVEAILTVVRGTVRHMGVPAGIRVITEATNTIR